MVLGDVDELIKGDGTVCNKVIWWYSSIMKDRETQVSSRLDFRLKGFFPSWAKSLLLGGCSVNMDLVNINEDIGVNSALHQLPSKANIVSFVEVCWSEIHGFHQFHS